MTVAAARRRRWAAPRPRSTTRKRAETERQFLSLGGYRDQLCRRTDALGQLAVLRGVFRSGRATSSTSAYRPRATRTTAMSSRYRRPPTNSCSRFHRRAWAASNTRPVPSRGDRHRLHDRRPAPQPFLPLHSRTCRASCTLAAGCRRWRSTDSRRSRRTTGRQHRDRRRSRCRRAGSISTTSTPLRTICGCEAPTRGAATFARGEGLCAAGDRFAFTCTIGGPARLGQVFTYTPSPSEGRAKKTTRELTLIAEADEDSLLRNGDNLTMAPWGDLIVCEDTARSLRACGHSARWQPVRNRGQRAIPIRNWRACASRRTARPCSSISSTPA